MDLLPEDTSINIDKRDDTSIYASMTAPNPAMQSSFQGSTIEEEDFIDNIEPDLIISTSSEGCSSLFASDSGLEHADEKQQAWDKDHSFHEDKTTSSKNNPSETLVKVGVEQAPRPARSSTPKSKLSLSMHDISVIPTYPLTEKASHASSSTIQSRSMTTDASVPKSKDSGFPRSVSCYSLSSSKRYDHVESKVKKYISQIKLENSSSRRSKTLFNTSINKEAKAKSLNDTNNEPLSVGMLIPVIDKLKGELDDKDKMLLKLQENYDNLLMEYAAAKNRIDYLRISSASICANSPMPFNFDVTTSYKKPKASENILLQPELDKLLNESTSSDFENSFMSKVKLRNPNQSYTKTFARSSKPATDEKDLQCAINIDEAKHDVPRDEDKELSPERLNRQIADNPFVKVKRWQDSLPPFGLIEPSSYDSLPSTSNSTNPGKSDSASSKLSNLYSTRDDTGSNNTSSLILYSRSISQPNYILSRDETCFSMDMNQANSLLSLSSAQFSSGSVKCETEWTSQGFDIDINKALPISPITSSSKTDSKHSHRICHQRYLRVPEISHLCRKKIVNWKAKNILFDHMKGLTCHKAARFSRSLPITEVKCASREYDVDELNLVHCLDEVNQCAKNLNGESEAIMNALAKQLKASDSSLHLKL